MNNHSDRIRRFTASQIYRLIPKGKRLMTEQEKADHKAANPRSRATQIVCRDTFTSLGETYIKEKFYETVMQRSIDVQVSTIPMRWGKLMEVVIFDLLGLEWKMEHDQPIVHETIPHFSGSPDLKVPKVKVGEIKCYYPKAFCDLSLALMQENVSVLRDEFPSEYWQTVAGALLYGVKRAELIAYLPYRSELEQIIKEVEETNFLERNGLNPADYYFLDRMDMKGLAWLPDNSKISNINSFEYDIPDEDLEYLEHRIRTAGQRLEDMITQSYGTF